MTARLPTIAAAAACALALAACGGDDADSSQGEQVADTVREFAQADGPEACDLLGTQALQDNYGGDTYGQAKDNCKARSKSFEGEPVKITFVKVTSDTTARVNAENTKGRLFVVSLSKPEDDWVIERIVPQRKQ
ncbi:MAG TPA: hypothetical protein VF520_06255 [Thermoleophilaceae bacterium]